MKRLWIVSKLKLTSYVNAFSLKRVSGYVRFLSVILLSVCSTSVLASYQYVYTGNPFTTTFTSHNYEYPPPYDTSIVTSEEHISVVFTSPTLLTSGTSLDDSLNFTISTVSADGARVLPYPYPYPREPGAGPGSPSNPNYEGVFDILAVDDKGMPTDWNISVDYNYPAPTGRFTQTFIKTSTTQDSTYGGYEGFYEYHGQLDTNHGKWSVVTVVPEPKTYALMLTGLGLIGFSARRRRTRKADSLQ